MLAIDVPLPQAARRLKMNWRRYWDLCLDGRLDAYQVAGRWIVRGESLARFEEERSAARNAPAPTPAPAA
jgi:hypothetical protein